MVGENYELLSAQVAQMPAKGYLASFSSLKYGERIDERSEKLKTALNEKPFDSIINQNESKNTYRSKERETVSLNSTKRKI